MGRNRFYGWVALAGAMAVYFSMCGNYVYSFGVFLPVFSEEFNWSRTALSGTLTASEVAHGLIGPLVGISISRFGARKNIIVGNTLAALGLLGMAFVEEVWHVYLFYGVLAGIGISFGSFLSTTAMVNDWFIRRRSLAMSLVLAAGGVGGLIFPPFISWLITSLGWQVAWTFLAGIHLILAVAIGGVLVRNKPEEMGQFPDGTVSPIAPGTITESPGISRVYQTPVDWTVRAALRTRALWLILACDLTLWFPFSTLTIHEVAYLQDKGFTSLTAASALGLMVGISIIGRLLFGVLGTRFEGKYLIAVCLALMFTGMIILMNARTLPLVYACSVLCGIGFGGMLVNVPVILGAYFGRTHYARILGWTAPVLTVFGAGSPLIAGLIFDVTGSYMLAFQVGVVLLGVGVVLALLIRPPKPSVSIPDSSHS
ncbi:MAG: MFS transporter [Dehalococcoidales bacterium]|nr:MAG: MFS transporter [Dehalococcoidales bacterium]